jgi:hypothetical protein
MNSNDEIYKIKYLKYKQKYLNLKINLKGGATKVSATKDDCINNLKEIRTSIDAVNNEIANINNNEQTGIKVFNRNFVLIHTKLESINTEIKRNESLLDELKKEQSFIDLVEDYKKKLKQNIIIIKNVVGNKIYIEDDKGVILSDLETILREFQWLSNKLLKFSSLSSSDTDKYSQPKDTGIDKNFLSGLLKKVGIDPTNRNVKDTIANIASNSEDEKVKLCIEALTEIEKSIEIIEQPPRTYDILKIEDNTNKQFKIIEDNIETINTLIETDTTLLNKLNNERTYLFKNKLEICILKLSNYRVNISFNLIIRFNLICSTLRVIREQLRSQSLVQEISAPKLGLDQIIKSSIENQAKNFVSNLDFTMRNIKQEMMKIKLHTFNKGNFNLQLVELNELINNMNDNWNKDIKFPKIIITAPSSDLMENILFFLTNITFVYGNADTMDKLSVDKLYFFILMYNNFAYLNKIKDNLIKLNNEKITKKTKKTSERYLEYSNIIISIEDCLKSIILGKNLISNFFIINQYNNEFKRELITAIKLFENSTKEMLVQIFFFAINSDIKPKINQISTTLNSFLLELEEVGKDEGDKNEEKSKGGGGEAMSKSKSKSRNNNKKAKATNNSLDEDAPSDTKATKDQLDANLDTNFDANPSANPNANANSNANSNANLDANSNANLDAKETNANSNAKETKAKETKANPDSQAYTKIGGKAVDPKAEADRIEKLKTKIRNNGFSESKDIDDILEILDKYHIGIDDACAIFKEVRNNSSEINDKYINNLKESVSLTGLENIKSYLDEKTAAEAFELPIKTYLDYKDNADNLNMNVKEYIIILEKAKELKLSVKNYLKYIKKANKLNISMEEYTKILEEAKKQEITNLTNATNLADTANSADANSADATNLADSTNSATVNSATVNSATVNSAAANPDSNFADATNFATANFDSKEELAAAVEEDPIRKQLNDFIKSLDTKLETFDWSEYVINFNYLLSRHVNTNDINMYIFENIDGIVSFFTQNPNFKYVFNYTPIISNGKIKSEYTKIQCISLFLIGLLNSSFEKHSLSKTKEVLSNIIKFEIKGGKSLQLLFSKYINESEDVLVTNEIQKILSLTSQEPLHRTDDLDVLVISNKQNVKNKSIRDYYSAKLLLLIYNLVKQNDINIMCQLPTIFSSVFKGSYQTIEFSLVPFIDIDAEESNPEYFKFEKLEEIRVDYEGVSLLFYIPQLNDYIKEKRYYEQLYLPDPNDSYFLQKIRKSLPYAYGLSNYLLNKSSSTERGGGHSAHTGKSSSLDLQPSASDTSVTHTKEGGGHSDKIKYLKYLDLKIKN